jgi:hypothetical protein
MRSGSLGLIGALPLRGTCGVLRAPAPMDARITIGLVDSLGLGGDRCRVLKAKRTSGLSALRSAFDPMRTSSSSTGRNPADDFLVPLRTSV